MKIIKIPDTVFIDTVFLYDKNDEFWLRTQGKRQSKQNGYTLLDDGKISSNVIDPVLAITNPKKLEDFEFYTHEFTEISARAERKGSLWQFLSTPGAG